MAFHRLITPTYFGGLVGGQDYLNTPSDPSVGGSGVPAIMDPIKSGGPNDGTYFCAFGEDGRSAAVNRGFKALGENTDALDDILRTSIPSIINLDATAAGAVTTVALVGEIWVGETGTANNQTNRDKIVRVTDQNNNDLEVSGAKIVATLIHDGASVNVVGTQASGFRTNASVNFTPSIPNTTTYRVWYGVRNNYANISAVAKGALFREQLRTINNVSGEVRSLLRQVHSELSVNQAWDAAFDSTIRSLAAAGLNERYRRARLQPAGFVTGDFDVAGSGATIFLDGRAVSLVTDNLSYDASLTAYRDPNAAALRVVNEVVRSSTSGPIVGSQGGEVALWTETEWRPLNQSDTAMHQRSVSSGPALVQVIPYDIREADYDGPLMLTFISPSTASAVLNPDSSAGVTGRATIQCAVGQHFSLNTPTRTAIRLGVDMLEVIRPDGDTSIVIIDTLVSSTRVRGRLISGGALSFGDVAIPGVALRWLQPVVKVGGSLLTDRDTAGLNVSGNNVLSRPIIAIPPAMLTDSLTFGNEGLPAFFGSQTGSVADATAEEFRARALEWGATASPDAGGTVDGVLTARGWLNGDGSIHGTNGVLTGTLNVTGNVVFGGALAVTGDLTVDDITADEITADDVIVDTLRELRPERFYHLREDWLAFTQGFTPDIIWATQSSWDFNEIDDIFTLNNGTPSAKNPGQMQVIGAGGSVTRQISIRPTNLMPFSFASILSMTVVVAITEDPANVATSMTIGFVDNTSFQNGGNDALTLFYGPAFDWVLGHRVGGVNGPQNNTALGSQVNGQFVVFRFLKIANGNLQVYFNDVLATTVAVADLPTGLGTFNMHFLQSVADDEATIFVVDFVDLVVDTGAVRSGAP